MTKNQKILEYLFQIYHQKTYLDSDPVGIVHQFSDARDREVVGFIAAAFAFGNIKAIRPFLESLLQKIGTSPTEKLCHLTPEDLNQISSGRYYRWIKDHDIALFLFRIGETLREHGTLENAFFQPPSNDIALPAGLQKNAKNTYLAEMASFREKFLSHSTDQIPFRRRNYFKKDGSNVSLRNASDTLLPDPIAGAAKRYHLWLRWMIRPDDGIDLGCWKKGETRRLLMPVDTHVYQTVKLLGLTRKTTVNLAMAMEVTKRLRRFDPGDPVRFDFSMTRPGILGLKQVIKDRKLLENF